VAQIAAFFVLVVVAPVAAVGVSPRVEGHRKVRWMLVATLLSWVGYLAFLAVTRPGGSPTARGT